MKISSAMLALGLSVGILFCAESNCFSQTTGRTMLGLGASGNGAAFVAPGSNGRYPIIARGAEREAIKSTPIEQRPYRPFHFYGNTVRRNFYGQSMRPFGSRF